jgi:HTH-type transcriptional regulator, glycine betaine synthesis regulator
MRVVLQNPEENLIAGEAYESFKRECLALFGESVQIFGIPRSVGLIFGVIFVSPRPMCFSDIVEALDISKGSVSQGLHLLRSIGAINETSGKHSSSIGSKAIGNAKVSRRDYFEAEMSLRKLIGGVLRDRVDSLSSAGSSRITRLRSIRAKNSETQGFILERINKLESWRSRLSTVLPLLIVFLGKAKDK